jgi:hypothetical protein
MKTSEIVLLIFSHVVMSCFVGNTILETFNFDYSKWYNRVGIVSVCMVWPIVLVSYVVYLATLAFYWLATGRTIK